MKILYISTDNWIYNWVIEYKEQMKKIFEDKIQFSFLKWIDVHPFDDEISISINTRTNLDFLFSYNLIVFSNTTNKNAVIKMKYLFDTLIKEKSIWKQIPQIAIWIHRGENTQEDKWIQLFKEEIESLNIILITNSDINKRYYERIFNKSIVNLDLIYEPQKTFLSEDKNQIKDNSCICCSRITHQKKIEDVVKLETPLKKTCIAVYEYKPSCFKGIWNKQYCDKIFELNKKVNSPCIFTNDDKDKITYLKKASFLLDWTEFPKQMDKDRMQYTLLEGIDYFCIPVLKKSYFWGYIKENINWISFETFQEYNNALIKKSDSSLFDELFLSIIHNNSILLENYTKTTYDKFISFYSKFL